jgi:hypothetical protein
MGAVSVRIDLYIEEIDGSAEGSTAYKIARPHRLIFDGWCPKAVYLVETGPQQDGKIQGLIEVRLKSLVLVLKLDVHRTRWMNGKNKLIPRFIPRFKWI